VSPGTDAPPVIVAASAAVALSAVAGADAAPVTVTDSETGAETDTVSVVGLDSPAELNAVTAYV